MNITGMVPFLRQQGLKELIFARKIRLILTGCYLRRRRALLSLYAGKMMIFSFDACNLLNDDNTELCTKIERDFLRALWRMLNTNKRFGKIENDKIIFKGNICSPDGKKKIEIEKTASIQRCR